MVKKPYTLRKKLLIWLLVPLLILFAARAIYNYRLSITLSNDVYDRGLYTLAMSLEPQIALINGRPVVNLTRSAHDILLFDKYDLLYFAIRDANGRIISGNEDIPPPQQPIAATSDYQFYDGRIRDKNVRIVAMRTARLVGQRNQPILITVAETTVKRGMLAREVIGRILIPQVFIIFLATTIVWFGVGKGLAPLRRLQSAVANRSHLDLSPIEDKNVPEEARPLIMSINDLMRRLHTVIDSQNRFISDAAHQLRTPLAGLVAQIGLAQRCNDPMASKHCMEQICVSADRITRLVHQLLALARNEPDADKMLVKSRVDLNQLVAETVKEWVPEALKKGIDLGFEGEKHPVKIMGDAQRLKEMINNLLDNAIRYTQSSGRVTAQVSVNGDATLVIEDNGPGIPPEERERVFERFYRVLGNAASGSGLGLAIVREIARAHRAEIVLADNPAGRGAAVKVTFGQGDA